MTYQQNKNLYINIDAIYILKFIFLSFKVLIYQETGLYLNDMCA